MGVPEVSFSVRDPADHKPNPMNPMKKPHNSDKSTPSSPSDATAANTPDLPENQVQRIIDRLRIRYHQNIAKSTACRGALAE